MYREPDREEEDRVVRGVPREDERVWLRAKNAWHDLTFVGDTLLVAAGPHGLGVLPTRGIGPELRQRMRDEQRSAQEQLASLTPEARARERELHETFLEMFGENPASLNEAVRFWQPTAGGRVVSVAGAGAALGAFVVVDRDGPRELFWFDAADGTVAGPLELP
jgi:hypothetical protein